MKGQLTSRRRWFWVLILVVILAIAVNTLRAIAAPINRIQLQTTPTPTTQPIEVGTPTPYSWQSIAVVGALLGLLGGVFSLMFVWAQKFDSASYLGTLFRSTITDIEFKRLKSDLREKWGEGEYHREVIASGMHPLPKPPEGAEWLTSSLLSTYEAQHELTNRFVDLGYMDRPNVTIKGDDKNQTAALKKYKQDEQKWKLDVDIEARHRYQIDLEKARSGAQGRADTAIDFDLSVLRGRGAEFVLQFSTVVIIIFAVLVLGVLNILESQAISTLLAAIIGYVLGQATARARRETGQDVVGKVESENGETNPPP